MKLLTSNTYKRKLQEAYLAMELEAIYEEILEAYLNTVYLAGTTVKTLPWTISARAQSVDATGVRHAGWIGPKALYL